MIYLDGELHPGPKVPFDPSDRGLLLGDGLFGTMPAFGRKVFRRADHIMRMVAACETLGIPVESARLHGALDALTPVVDAAGTVIRLTVTRGPGPRGLALPADAKPSVMGTHAPWTPSVVFRPVRLGIATARRNEHSLTSRLKTLGYLDAVLAMEDARRAELDDALFLNIAGRAVCSTMANLFMLRGDVLVTPPVSEGVLPGIMRSLVLRRAETIGFSVEEQPIGLDDLRAADGVFLTNSVRLVTPVAEIDGHVFPAGGRGAARKVLDAILAEIEKECGGQFKLGAAAA